MSSLSTFRIYTISVLFTFGLGCAGLMGHPETASTEVTDTGAAVVGDLHGEEVVTQEMEVLILWGSKDPKAAKAWKKDNNGLLEAVFADPEAISIIQSDTMLELNPGFHILVAGYCPSPDVEMPTTPGEAARDIAKKTFSGAYLRTVNVPPDKASCPRLTAPLKEVTVAWQTHASTPETCQLSQVYVESGRTIQDIATFPIPCPEVWSAIYSKTKKQLLFHAADLWHVEIKTQTTQKVDFPHGDIDAAYWEGDKIGIWAIDWLEQNAETVKIANGGEKTLTWIELDGKRITYDSEGIGTEPIACIKHIQTDTGWKADTPQIFEPSEGTSAPFCVDETALKRISPHIGSFGDQYPRINDAAVRQAQDSNGGVPLTNGGWAWAEGDKYGGVAITVEWFNGDMLQGDAMAWDGKVWHPFEYLAGRLKRVQVLGDGTVYLCTDTGFGVFQSRTGKVRYWRDGACLALEANPHPL